jgi:hypothetical protein
MSYTVVAFKWHKPVRLLQNTFTGKRFYLIAKLSLGGTGFPACAGARLEPRGYNFARAS